MNPAELGTQDVREERTLRPTGGEGNRRYLSDWKAFSVLMGSEVMTGSHCLDTDGLLAPLPAHSLSLKDCGADFCPHAKL